LFISNGRFAISAFLRKLEFFAAFLTILSIENQGMILKELVF